MIHLTFLCLLCVIFFPFSAFDISNVFFRRCSKIRNPYDSIWFVGFFKAAVEYMFWFWFWLKNKWLFGDILLLASTWQSVKMCLRATMLHSMRNSRSGSPNIRCNFLTFLRANSRALRLKFQWASLTKQMNIKLVHCQHPQNKCELQPASETSGAFEFCPWISLSF